MAHPDLEALFETLLAFSQKMLSKYGGFHPWGATMSSTGEIQWIAADDGEEFPRAQDLIEMLTQTFQQQSTRGLIRAAGICYDVRVVPPGQSEKSDAVCCSLEHFSGESLDVYVPYAKTEYGIEYADIFAWFRDPQCFSGGRHDSRQ